MFKKLYKTFLIMMLILTSLIPVASVMADTASDNQPNFSVSIVKNPHQIGKLGYFDLSGLAPGQSTTLELIVGNLGSDSITFDVSANNAATNSNLIIDYSGTLVAEQKLTGVHFADLAKVVHPTITLAAHSQTTVQVVVTMPHVKFDGQIVGGIYLKKHETAAQQNSSGIKNTFSYVNSVILRQGNQKLVAAPKLSSASYAVKDTLPYVIGHVKNEIQAYANEAKVTHQILDSQGKVIKSMTETLRAFAPKSETDTSLTLDHLLAPGKYYYVMKVVAHGTTTESKQPFMVNATDAAVAGVSMINSMLWLMISLILLFLLIILFLLWFLLWKRRKKEDEDEDGTVRAEHESQPRRKKK